MQNQTMHVLQHVTKKPPLDKNRSAFIRKANSLLQDLSIGDRYQALNQIQALSKEADTTWKEVVIDILKDKVVDSKCQYDVDIVETSTTPFQEVVIDSTEGTSTSNVHVMESISRTENKLDLTALEGTLLEISTLQGTLGRHLQEQSERIESLNTDADITDQNLELGNNELQKALEEMTKSRAWFSYTLCVLSSVLLFLDWFYD